MLRSMTGYAQAQRQIEGINYALEIRSVNNRYFKAILRLPEPWGSAETQIESLLRERLYRGTVNLSLRMKGGATATAYTVNLPVLEHYMEQLEVVQPESTDLKLSVDLSGLLALPGVCTPPELEALLERSRDKLMQMIDQAVEGLLAMRAQEGQAVAAELEKFCRIIAAQTEGIAQRAPTVLQEYHQRLQARVAELMAQSRLPLDQADLAREVALFAERSDVAEELSRLAGHVRQFRQVMTGENQPGRKLDFIAQEMLREANTIASKSGDAQIIMSVVEIKTNVDRIKEQVQNVE
jgi:uncharacterized protein (TIGR00255 family)